MIANYHTHTARCHHAAGADEEYVRNAIAGGLHTLGFSDHTPQFFPTDYYSTMRMRPEELDGYIQSLLKLRQKYEKKLQIAIGLEVEYYPDCFTKLTDFIRNSEIEYLILGQHWIGNEIGEAYLGSTPTDDPAKLQCYCSQVMEAMDTGLFTYLAHPDVVFFDGDSHVYEAEMAKLCEHAKKCGIPLELNLLGLRSQRHYPAARFWKIAGEVGCSVILGSDAHSPDTVCDSASEEIAKIMVEKFGLNLMQEITLIKP